MEQPISQSSSSSLPWLIRRPGRIAAAIVAIAVAYLLTRGLPDELNLLIPYNTGVGVYLVLTGALMRRASPEDAAELSRRGEPNNILTLIIVIALSVVSLIGGSSFRTVRRLTTGISRITLLRLPCAIRRLTSPSPRRGSAASPSCMRFSRFSSLPRSSVSWST